MKKKGFTLIELVMVIAILGILAAMVLPRFINLQEQAKKSATKGALGAMRAAIAVEYASNIATAITPNFPTSVDGSMFQDGQIPVNKVVGDNATSVFVDIGLTAHPGSIANSSIGWFYGASGRVWANWSGAVYNDASTW